MSADKAEKMPPAPPSGGRVDFTSRYRPKTIEDLVTQFCCRVLAHLGLEQPKQFRWTGERLPNP